MGLIPTTLNAQVHRTINRQRNANITLGDQLAHDVVGLLTSKHEIATHPFAKPPIPPIGRVIRRYPPLSLEKWSLTTAIPC